MYDIISESTSGKYFQNKKNPRLVVEFTNFPAVVGECENPSFRVFKAYFPLQNKVGNISLNQIKEYEEISKQEFEKVKTDYQKGLLNDLTGNLSEEEGRSIIFKRILENVTFRNA